MDTKGMIVVLLILAIVFSGVSIFASLAALSVEIPVLSVSGEVVAGNPAGGVGLHVEEHSFDGGNG